MRGIFLIFFGIFFCLCFCLFKHTQNTHTHTYPKDESSLKEYLKMFLFDVNDIELSVQHILESRNQVQSYKSHVCFINRTIACFKNLLQQIQF